LLAHVTRTRGTIDKPSSPSAEPALVIEHREALIYMICAAAELEHALMCQYLFAAFSLKDNKDEGLTDEQLAAVNRWRTTIFGVASQEMLHLALTANMLTALGASPHLSRPNLPQPAHHYPAAVKLAFLPFGEQALRHFLYLERPEGMALEDAEGMGALGEAAPLMTATDIVPRAQEFSTVGHLYRSIEEGFGHLVDKLGAQNLFVGPPQAQITGDAFRWPELRPVVDLPSARAAIEEIVQQGEGSQGDWRQAHFGRFKAVLDEFLVMKAADPGFEPARPVVAAKVRRGEGDTTGPLITDPLTAKVADLANVIYEVLLLLLYRLLARIDETDEEATTLADVAVGLMFQGVGRVGQVLSTLPVGPELPGATAGAPFELFYQPDYLLPHREAAWLLISERLAEAGALAERLSGTVPTLGTVATALHRHAETIGGRAKRTP
jgi:Ferritin-like